MPKKAKVKVDKVYEAYVKGESINSIAERTKKSSQQVLDHIKEVEAENGRHNEK